MKKTLFTCLLFLGISGLAQAQKKEGKEPAFQKGSSTLGVFTGFGVSYNYYGSSVSMPAIGGIFDHGIVDVGPGTIGIGGIVGYKYASWKRNGHKASWSNFVIGVRGTYHLNLLKDKNNKFDPYAGVVLGVRIHDYDDTYYTRSGVHNPNNYNSTYPIYGMFVGAKYNFSPNFGVFSELGYDISLLKIGVNFNF